MPCLVKSCYVLSYHVVSCRVGANDTLQIFAKKRITQMGIDSGINNCIVSAIMNDSQPQAPVTDRGRRTSRDEMR